MVSALHYRRDAGPAQHHVDACTQTEILVEHAAPAPAPAAHASPPDVVEYVTSGTAPVRHVEFAETLEFAPPLPADSAPPCVTAPVVDAPPVSEFVAPVPGVTCAAPAPVPEHAIPFPAVHAAPAPDIVNVAPSLLTECMTPSVRAPVVQVVQVLEVQTIEKIIDTPVFHSTAPVVVLLWWITSNLIPLWSAALLQRPPWRRLICCLMNASYITQLSRMLMQRLLVSMSVAPASGRRAWTCVWNSSPITLVVAHPVRQDKRREQNHCHTAHHIPPHRASGLFSRQSLEGPISWQVGFFAHGQLSTQTPCCACCGHGAGPKGRTICDPVSFGHADIFTTASCVLTATKLREVALSEILSLWTNAQINGMVHVGSGFSDVITGCGASILAG